MSGKYIHKVNAQDRAELQVLQLRIFAHFCKI